MELLEVKMVRIGDRDWPICKTNRAYILYDELTSSDGEVKKMSIRKETSILFYCMAKAGAKKADQDFPYSLDEFLDIIDDYPDDLLINFSAAIETKKAGSGKKK